MKNGTNVMYNTSTTTLSNHLVNAAIDNYTNILKVTGDHHTQNISCAAYYNSKTNTFRQLTIEGNLTGLLLIIIVNLLLCMAQ